MQLNDRAAALFREMVQEADELRIRVIERDDGGLTLDCGIDAAGGLEAGRRLSFYVNCSPVGEPDNLGGVLVTFNGKSFDWPQVCDRTTRYAAAAGTLPELAHFDLLHHSRRKYGNRFGDCRLQTLEQYVCGRAQDSH